jgi:hypothetical protein
MCHSVEMYMPGMTRRAAEHRIGQVDYAAAERERWLVGAGIGLWARLKRMFGRRPVNDLAQEQVTDV